MLECQSLARAGQHPISKALSVPWFYFYVLSKCYSDYII